MDCLLFPIYEEGPINARTQKGKRCPGSLPPSGLKPPSKDEDQRLIKLLIYQAGSNRSTSIRSAG